MTFRQVQVLGGRVIKGSKGCPVVFWQKREKEPEAAAPAEETVVAAGEKAKSPPPFLRIYTVFNIAQIQGIDFPKPISQPIRPFEPIAMAEQIVNGWEDAPVVKHGASEACYVPAIDEIHLPDKGRFHSPADYYAIHFHEMGHATGAPQRLNRKLNNRFADTNYAREELIAEMTSAFLCAKCGIDNHTIPNQAAYLANWMQALGKDPKMVVIAASQAQQAADLIQGIAAKIYPSEPQRMNSSLTKKMQTGMQSSEVTDQSEVTSMPSNQNPLKVSWF